jgi:uncharacterized membrane protein
MNNNKLLNYWERIRSSFWFLPAIMATAAVVLAFVLIWLDGIVGDDLISSFALLYTGGVEGTRGLLSSIAGSMIGVAGTTFSITIAVLTLASSNYGPRLLRNFMSDTGNQVVLGTFVATFLYSLIVLRSVRASDENGGGFVPHIATTFAIFLAIASIGVLIYFFHHITSSIQVSTIAANVRHDLEKTIERVFPAHIGHDVSEDDSLKGDIDLPADFDRESCPVKATGNGYIQTVDNKGLLEITTKNNLLIYIQHRPGDYIVQGSELVQVWPGDCITDELTQNINKAFTFGSQRTMTQDVEFGILQLVEIAVRALSPSLNDPFTTVRCLDQLSVVLCRLAEQDFPSRYRYDDQHKLRVIADSVSFAQLTDVAFDQIRQNGSDSVMVLNRLLHVIAVVAPRVCNLEDCSILRRHAMLVEQSSREGLTQEADLEDVEQQFRKTMQAISKREEQLLVKQ